MNQQPTSANPLKRFLTTSLIAAIIEFFDLYIYPAAAVLVFPKLFLPAVAHARRVQ